VYLYIINKHTKNPEAMKATTTEIVKSIVKSNWTLSKKVKVLFFGFRKYSKYYNDFNNSI